MVKCSPGRYAAGRATARGAATMTRVAAPVKVVRAAFLPPAVVPYNGEMMEVRPPRYRSFRPGGALLMSRFRSPIRLLLFLIVCLLLLQPGSVRAQENSAKAEKLATVEGITEYKLPNGVRVLLFPDPSSAYVTVNMTVLVGSRHEGYGETG